MSKPPDTVEGKLLHGSWTFPRHMYCQAVLHSKLHQQQREAMEPLTVPPMPLAAGGTKRSYCHMPEKWESHRHCYMHVKSWRLNAITEVSPGQGQQRSLLSPSHFSPGRTVNQAAMARMQLHTERGQLASDLGGSLNQTDKLF